MLEILLDSLWKGPWKALPPKTFQRPYAIFYFGESLPFFLL